MAKTPRASLYAGLGLAILLAGCGLVPSPDVAAYEPYVPKDSITDQGALDQAKSYCLTAAKNYHTPFSVIGLGTGAAQGALDSATPAAASPPTAGVILGAGAAAAAGKSLLETLGLSTQNQLRVYLGCLHDKAERTRAFLMLDPQRP